MQHTNFLSLSSAHSRWHDHKHLLTFLRAVLQCHRASTAETFSCSALKALGHRTHLPYFIFGVVGRCRKPHLLWLQPDSRCSVWCVSAKCAKQTSWGAERTSCRVTVVTGVARLHFADHQQRGFAVVAHQVVYVQVSLAQTRPRAVPPDHPLPCCNPHNPQHSLCTCDAKHSRTLALLPETGAYRSLS